jgi:DNA-directed RNA polymerase beta subunit
MKLDRYPNAQVIWMAMMALDSNQEDGIVGKDSTFANGLFSYMKLTTIKAELSDNQTTGRPKKMEENSHLDEQGIVREGEWMEEGQILVNIIRPVTSNIGKVEYIESPVRLDAYASGYVMGVEKIDTPVRLIHVKLLVLRKFGAGGKLVARYSQKGMTCESLPDEKLPKFNIDGQELIPSLFINPHCIPGRMTVGFLIEGILTMAGILEGKRKDGSVFSDPNLDHALDVLRDNGYPEDMKFDAINPNTGKLYENKIYCVPIAYQVLAHNYADEVQYRGPGGRRKQDTRQPVGHRGFLGASAQRYGEQERDATIAWGATNFLHDRICTASDAEPLLVCKTCGYKMDERLVEEDKKIKAKLICRTPDCKALPVVTPDVPFVFHGTLEPFINGLGISVKYKTGPQTGFFESDPRVEQFPKGDF